MLLAVCPLALIGLPTGKQVRPIPMGHIRVALAQIAVPIGEAIGTKAMAKSSAVLTSIVAVVSTLLHAQALAHAQQPFTLVVVTVMVLAHPKSVPAPLLKVAVESGALDKGLAAQAMVHAACPLHQWHSHT